MHQITSNIFGSVPIVQKYTIFLYLQKNGIKKTTNLKISKACELTGNPEKGKALKPEEIPQEQKRASEDTLL